MNTMLATHRAVAIGPLHRRLAATSAPARVTLRPATVDDAVTLHTLIEAHATEGRLLPRALEELTVHAPRFIVALRRGRIVGCAELAPLSGRVAEVRSLVVSRRARSLGVGRLIIGELQRRARLAGFEELCAFAHEAAFFVRLGFSIVPHTWVPEKIARDCSSCELFRRCGQHALIWSPGDSNQSGVDTFVPLASLRG